MSITTNEQMDFPETFDEFAKGYGFADTEKIYTNGIDLIPVFRVKQWLEHIEEEYEKKISDAYFEGEQEASDNSPIRGNY